MAVSYFFRDAETFAGTYRIRSQQADFQAEDVGKYIWASGFLGMSQIVHRISWEEILVQNYWGPANSSHTGGYCEIVGRTEVPRLPPEIGTPPSGFQMVGTGNFAGFASYYRVTHYDGRPPEEGSTFQKSWLVKTSTFVGQSAEQAGTYYDTVGTVIMVETIDPEGTDTNDWGFPIRREWSGSMTASATVNPGDHGEPGGPQTYSVTWNGSDHVYSPPRPWPWYADDLFTNGDENSGPVTVAHTEEALYTFHFRFFSATGYLRVWWTMLSNIGIPEDIDVITPMDAELVNDGSVEAAPGFAFFPKNAKGAGGGYESSQFVWPEEEILAYDVEHPETAPSPVLTLFKSQEFGPFNATLFPVYGLASAPHVPDGTSYGWFAPPYFSCLAGFDPTTVEVTNYHQQAHFYGFPWSFAMGQTAP